jgi:hypothetical protein
MMWLAYIGAALGIVINSSLAAGVAIGGFSEWGKQLYFLILFWPLEICVILLAGLRHVFSIPSDLAANWIFRLTESTNRLNGMSAVECFAMLYAVVPVFVVVLPLSWHFMGWALALRMTTLQVITSLTTFEILFYSWQKFPFTCSYIPGKRPLVGVVSWYVVVLGIIIPQVCLAIRAASEFIEIFPLYVVFFTGIWLWRRRARLDGWGESRLLYDDAPEGILDLGIKELTYSSVAMIES